MGAIFTTKSTKTIDISLRVNGELRRVSFMPSVLFGVKGESLYSTADDAMVQALKNHKYYGVYFFLKSEDTPVPKKEEPKTIEEELSEPTSPIIVESVTNRAMAIAYIQGTYEESFTSTSNEDMRREAARRWNILFPKWTR